MLKNNDFEYEKEIGDDVNKIKNNEENIFENIFDNKYKIKRNYYNYPDIDNKYKNYSSILANNGYYSYKDNGYIKLEHKKKHITEQQEVMDKLCKFMNNSDNNINETFENNIQNKIYNQINNNINEVFSVLIFLIIFIFILKIII